MTDRVGFKLALGELAGRAKDFSLRESMRCWELHHSKRKSAYNQCCKQATVLMHVVADGRKRLKDKKRRLMSDCEARLVAPDALKQCKAAVFASLQTDLDSLTRKFDREKAFFEAGKTEGR